MAADQVQEEVEEAAARLIQGAALQRQAGARLEWTPLWAGKWPRGMGPHPGRRQGAPRAQAPLGNPLTQEVRPHRAQSGAGLRGKPSALLGLSVPILQERKIQYSDIDCFFKRSKEKNTLIT